MSNDPTKALEKHRLITRRLFEGVDMEALREGLDLLSESLPDGRVRIRQNDLRRLLDPTWSEIGERRELAEQMQREACLTDEVVDAVREIIAREADADED